MTTRRSSESIGEARYAGPARTPRPGINEPVAELVTYLLIERHAALVNLARMAHADAETRPDAIWLNARLATFAANQPGIGAIERGALAARDGRLVFVGAEADLPDDWRCPDRASDACSCVSSYFVTSAAIRSVTHSSA